MSASSSIPPEDSASLPEWAKQAVEAASARTVARPTFESPQKSPEWPLLLEAAVVSTFLPSELAPACPEESGRALAESKVLEYAEPATTNSGMRWELRRDVRAAVLRQAKHDGDLQPVMERTVERFDDAVSKALRETLSEAPVKLRRSTDLPELEAMRVAASLLSGVDSVDSQSVLRVLDRLIRKRRFVEQCERICGKDFKIEVVGRDAELELLRGYVGVISAETFSGAINRGIQHSLRAIKGRKPLAIFGTGGVGKTTLLSRFMLEHIDSAQNSYPFAYLDFDRPSISPKDPFGLLAEICLQVSAQFEALDRSLLALRNEALEAQAYGETSDSAMRLERLVADFRSYVDKHLRSQESAFEWEHPVLIVLDTFEVVQYDANQVAHVERFLSHFIDCGWSRLRLIVAGRKRIDRLVGEVESLELEGLDIKGGAELLVRLSTRASKHLSSKNSSELARLLAIKRGALAKPKVHPLRIRIVGGIFMQEKERSADDIAIALASELKGDLNAGRGAANSLIDGVLIRRILGHVTDWRVRALADPGLVVRHITPKIIECVMAPGTPSPGSQTPRDSTDFEPWVVTQREAEEIYQSFSKEVALVESDGIALRHRQDVRSEMLPLIQARSPLRVERLHQLAFGYFRAAAAEGDDRQVETAAAEAVYHGLWSGQPLEVLDRIWTTGKVSNARIDPEEFKPGSLPVLFLKAHNGEGLTGEEARRLPRSIVQPWARQFGDRFLLAADPTASFKVLQVAIGPWLDDEDGAPALKGIGARLLYRAGGWQDCIALIRHAFEQMPWTRTTAEREVYVSLVRLLAHVNAKSGRYDALHIQAGRKVLEELSPIAKVETACHLMISLPRKRRLNLLEEAIAECPPRAWTASRRILRLAILLSESPRPDLVAMWVRGSNRPPPQQGQGRWYDEHYEWALKYALSASASAKFREEDWLQRRVNIAERIKDDEQLAAAIRYLMVFDHSDWRTVLGNALTRVLVDSNEMVAHLRRKDLIGSRSSSDGQEIVLGAIRSGRVLELADTIIEQAPETINQIFPYEKAANANDDPYPQSLRDLAAALLNWHQTLMSFVRGSM